MLRPVLRCAGALAGVCLLSFACSASGGPEAATPWVDGGVPDGTTTPIKICPIARGSENLSARVDVASLVGSAAPTMGAPRVIQVTELFDRFNTLCGRCHVSAANGGKQLSSSTFTINFDATWLAAITSEDPVKAMPPDNKAYSSRPDSDPVHQFVSLLQSWLDQGRPSDVFQSNDAAAGGGGVGSYAYAAMTNLGDCIPATAEFARSPSTEMASKDKMFADATELPTSLADTDLTTFDAEALAANGIVAYVPTYPLWSDGSGKLRHIRVPKGQHIKFNKDTQTMEIPPNTRFYKTFFRKIIDGAGHESNRKIETRLIVARPDTVDTDGRTPVPTALFGTYIWSEDEMTANLLQVPYRNGEPFADRTLEYWTDERAYHELVENLGPGSSTTFSDRLHAAAAKQPGLLQHYAVPGSLRCVQCHRGSPTQDFVLGFNPLQVAQRASGKGGTYEPAGADQINQLQRLIDYGVIAGMTSSADVVPLEQSQAPRAPRTPQELAAQAYMVGNCMHCHNPRGLPSILKPELATALNFMPGPGATGGGIFEMSLEAMSPVRSRGANQDVPMPYITPSLRDYPVATLDATMVRTDNGALLWSGDSATNIEATWTPKYSFKLEALDPSPPNFWGADTCPPKANDALGRLYCNGKTAGRTFVPAPWRSLIYRNVDAPFPYFDDYVPFPHMPMNTAGFDCRAPRIMGEWMVSLPAVRKLTSVNEDALPQAGDPDGTRFSYDKSPQPYVEVKPDDPMYAEAKAGAEKRLTEYRTGIRYKYCEDVFGTDIFDPLPAHGYHPDTGAVVIGGLGQVLPQDPAHPGEYVQPPLGIPLHSHWFNFDPTDDPPPWQPRRGPSWYDTLVKQIPDMSLAVGQMSVQDRDHDDPAMWDSEVDGRRRVVEALNQASLTDALRTYATTDVPFGIWQSKPGCEAKLAKMKRVSDFAASPALWMKAGDKPPAADAPVYMISPGAALYRHICFNCHGPKADGHGLMADALAASSEGQARPANFATGLFGPIENPNANMLEAFKGPNSDPELAKQFAPRYMAWMALGGTLQLIPNDVIHQVEATRVLGERRPNIEKATVGAVASANMLNLAKTLCSVVLPDPTGNQKPQPFVGGQAGGKAYPPFQSKDAPLIRTNGDFELWMNLCAALSPPVVRVYGLVKNTNIESFDIKLMGLYAGDAYPADQSILDHNRSVQAGLDPKKNYYPACIGDLPIDGKKWGDYDSASKAKIATVLQNFRAQVPMPDCAPGFLTNPKTQAMWVDTFGAFDSFDIASADAIREWTLRGAINAGMSVFAYLQQQEHDDPTRRKPLVYYNECQLLP